MVHRAQCNHPVWSPLWPMFTVSPELCGSLTLQWLHDSVPPAPETGYCQHQHKIVSSALLWWCLNPQFEHHWVQYRVLCEMTWQTSWCKYFYKESLQAAARSRASKKTEILILHLEKVETVLNTPDHVTSRWPAGHPFVFWLLQFESSEELAGAKTLRFQQSFYNLISIKP